MKKIIVSIYSLILILTLISVSYADETCAHCGGSTISDWQVITAATCQTAGVKQKVCSSCYTVYATESIPADSSHHNYQPGNTAATCEIGATSYRACSYCGDKIDVTPTAPALGHDWNTIQIIQPTCVSDGYTVVKCRNCGSEQRQNKQAHTGIHTPSSPSISNRVEPTCSTPGSYKESYFCTVCLQELPSTTISLDIDPSKHNYQLNTSKSIPATADTTGINVFTCSYNPSHEYTVTTEKLKKVSSIPFNFSLSSISVGQTTTINYQVLPTDAANKTIYFDSLTPTIATVSGTTITAVAPGTATIKAYSMDGGATETRQLTVTTASSGLFPGNPSNTPTVYTDHTIYYYPGSYANAGQVGFSTLIEAGKVAYTSNYQFSRSGYYQDGWSTTDGGPLTIGLNSSMGMLVSDYSFYPHWVANQQPYRLTVVIKNPSFGKVYFNGQEISSGYSYLMYPNTSATLSFTPFTNYYVWGIDFAGWGRDVSSSYTISYENMRGSDRTVVITFNHVSAPPRTGDDSQLGLWISTATISLAGICIISNNRKSKKSH